jgi:translation initiation factor IF-1
MSKEAGINTQGEVIDVQRNATFQVKLDSGHTIMGHVSGKMRKNEIRILMGDRVEIELSPYDLSKGRITRRL